MKRAGISIKGKQSVRQAFKGNHCARHFGHHFGYASKMKIKAGWSTPVNPKTDQAIITDKGDPAFKRNSINQQAVIMSSAI
jgi:hypothetical protein